LEYELHTEGNVLYFWISITCIKRWIVVYYGGHKFPQRAKFLLPLERDDAFTCFNGHSARKSAVLVVVWCYKATGDREHICESPGRLIAALQSGMTSLQVIIASGRSVGWGSNETLTLLYLVHWPSTPTYRVKTQDSECFDSHHWTDSAVT
jgi:hypothetical protein